MTTLTSRIVSTAIRGVSRTICRVDADELNKVPSEGPLIMVVNHVNFLDAPILFTHLQPRPVTGLVKIETWDNPIFNFLFSLWGAIPIRRGEADLLAFRQAKAALEQKKIMVIAPEGTRSRTGQLQSGKPGFALLAEMTKAPIQPVVFYGGELIWDNLHHLARTDFNIRVGDVFKLRDGINIRDKAARQGVTDEVMYRIAELLPEKYRGIYKDIPSSLQYLQKSTN